MADSAMSEVLVFLDKIGMFDVILPFLLIYVMIFALLEKTKILGSDMFEGKAYSKKNLNAIFAFACGFFAILSEKVVSAMNEAIGPIMLVLLIIVLFMLLYSSFKKDEGMEELGPLQKKVIFGIIFVTIILITLNSLHTENGDTWLEYSWDYITANTNAGFVGAIALLLGIAGFILWIGKDESGGKSK